MPTAFPFQRSENNPDGSVESCRLLDNRIRELRADIDAIFGIPDNTPITGPVGSMGADGTYSFAKLLQFLPKRKTTNQTISATTALQNDAELKFDGANQVAPGFYDFEMQVFYQSPAAAGLKIAFSVSVGATGVWASHSSGSLLILKTLAETHGIAADETIQVAWVKGNVNFPSTGIFQFQWAQTTSNPGGTGVVAGSSLLLRKFS